MNKKIMVAWVIVMIMLLGSILLIGLNEKDLTYVKLEYNIKYKTYKYLKENKKATDEIDINNLIDEKKVTKELIEKYCIKSVKIEKDFPINKYNIVKCKIK